MPSRELVISLTTGAVLVSVIVQMFTIERVVRFFRLDRPTVSDRLAKLEAQIEMALLHGGARTATCRAVTPCALYELRREDLEVVCEVCPEMKQALEQDDRVRRDELAALGTAVSDPVRPVLRLRPPRPVDHPPHG